MFKHCVYNLLEDLELQPSLPSVRTERASLKVERVKSLILEWTESPYIFLGVYRNNSIESFEILELFKLLEPQDYGQAKRDWLKNDKTSKSVKIILTTTPRAPSKQTLSRPQIDLGCCTLTYHRWQNIFQLEPTGTQEPLTGMATS